MRTHTQKKATEHTKAKILKYISKKNPEVHKTKEGLFK